MKVVAEPPPLPQPGGRATKFVAEPPPTLQPEYRLGNVIRPVVRLMSTWNVEPPFVPPSVPASAPAPDAADPHAEPAAPAASARVRAANAHATGRVTLRLRASGRGTASAGVCMRAIVQAARSPNDFPRASRAGSRAQFVSVVGVTPTAAPETGDVVSSDPA